MKNLLTSTALGGFLALTSLAVSPAVADDEPVSVSGNIAFVSDYRFRGVSLSDENFAIQGGFDVETASGIYVGSWASNIDGGTEVDLYGGYVFDVGGVEIDLGAIYYAYPNFDGDIDYGEVYASVGFDVTETLSVGGGFAYVPEQDNTGDEDNTYFFASGELALSEVITLAAGIGYEDGAFAPDDGKIDWSLGGTFSTPYGFDVGLTYIDTDVDDDLDPDGLAAETVIVSISRAL